MEIYVLDKNLQKIGVVDAFQSVIWANRYAEIGDCELYLSAEYLPMFSLGYYLTRDDDDMVCQIDRIILTTSADNGDYLAVSGTDAKGFLDRRIVWDTVTCKGKVELFVRKIIKESSIESDTARNFVKQSGGALLKLGALAGLPETLTEQVSYQNIGAKVREYCKSYGWGYRVRLDGDILAFEIYNGTDRRESVVFSDEYENLASTRYEIDRRDMANVSLVCGEGEGVNRIRGRYGSGSGVNRYEIYVDAKDISKDITYEELTDMYPGGVVEAFGGAYAYRVTSVDVQIIGSWHLSWLTRHFPQGSIVTVDGVDYYRVANAVLANLDEETPGDSTVVTIRNIIYMPYLMSRGMDKIAEHGQTETFEGSVVPDVTFVYKRDYFLGDVVTVRNQYGIEQAARIVEIVEVEDQNGYSFEPKFEKITG